MEETRLGTDFNCLICTKEIHVEHLSTNILTTGVLFEAMFCEDCRNALVDLIYEKKATRRQDD